METKVCKKCGEEKGIDSYYSKGNGDTRTLAECKKCTNERAKKYREENKVKLSLSRKSNYYKVAEQNKKRCKEWYENNKERAIELSKKFAQKNAEKVKEYKIKSAKKNRVRKLERAREYNKNNPDKRRIKKRNDVAMLKNYYVKDILVRSKFPKEHITTELIEVKTLIIKTQRLCRTSKN